MNKILKYTGILLAFIVLFAINACEDDISQVIEDLTYERVFSPLNLEATISNQTTVSLEWEENKGVEAYVVEISDDSLEFANIIVSATVDPTDIPYVYELPAGNSLYSARVKGTSSTTSDSKWTALAFKSLPENIFSGYDITMTGLGSINLDWTPGKAVTQLAFVDGEDQVTYDISEAEVTAGAKSITDLPNGSYEVQILNGTKVRGTQNYVMEGDVLVSSGGDLAGAINSASPGDVVILEAGGLYGFEGDMTIDKSIKIKGLDGDLPIVYATSGDRMFYVGSSLTPSDSIVFEKLYMSGYTNNNESDGQIRGVFDMESEACNIGAVKFISSKLYHMGRQIMRLRGGSDQTIGEFVVDDCIIYDLGQSSGSYGVFCATESNTNATVVRISNSTIHSLVCHFIRYDDPVACESIIVENCTFYQTPYRSGRYLMDVRNAVITNGIEVTDCIFGDTSYGDDPSIVGIRMADGIVLTISNSYATSDFVNSDHSIVNMLTGLGLSSTSIWSDPENGDFTLKNETLINENAGDPRWW